MTQNHIGLIGLATMGQNLALNLCDHGTRVVAWNLEGDVTREFCRSHRHIEPAPTIQALVDRLAAPRRILMMIQAGDPIDEVLSALLPMLSKGDIVIDGGNSHFADTRRRAATAQNHGIEFVGLGVSGGELGARHGPSLMLGASEPAWENLKDLLMAIAADGSAGKCARRIGADGAGHFVKMVHNGIEYADMQLIAETYDLLHRAMGRTNGEIADLFERWDAGPLQSYLIEITAKILRKRRKGAQNEIVDNIIDAAEQKGTGRWAVAAALELGVAIPTIAGAVDARVVSSQRSLRHHVANELAPDITPLETDETSLGDALWCAKLCAYAQGLQLIRAGSEHFRWGIAIADVARVWTGGCIIRARLLEDIAAAFENNPDLELLLLNQQIRTALRERIGSLRAVVSHAATAGIPVAAFGASLAWVDGIATAKLPQNLIQAQRDAFGAHTYRLEDGPDTPVHTDWLT